MQHCGNDVIGTAHAQNDVKTIFIENDGGDSAYPISINLTGMDVSRFCSKTENRRLP
jgi:hypothetical protein